MNSAAVGVQGSAPVGQRAETARSLPQVHHSVAAPGPESDVAGWRRMLGFLGPGYLIAVGYMDPGNWATDLAGGSGFGYSLLWIVLLSGADGDVPAGSPRAPRHRHRARPGSGLPRARAAALGHPAVAALRNRDLRDRPRRGDRHGDRAEAAVRPAADARRAGHGVRRPARALAAAARLPPARGVRDRAHRDRRRLHRPPGRDGAAAGGTTSSPGSCRNTRPSPTRTCCTSRSASSVRR